MKELLAILVITAIYIIYIIASALLIEHAVTAFKNERYFSFGIWLVAAICLIKSFM